MKLVKTSVGVLGDVSEKQPQQLPLLPQHSGEEGARYTCQNLLFTYLGFLSFVENKTFNEQHALFFLSARFA